MIILKLEECPILFLEHNENKSHKIGFHEFFSLFHPSLRTHQHLSRVVGIVLVFFYQYKLYAISFEERIARTLTEPEVTSYARHVSHVDVKLKDT